MKRDSEREGKERRERPRDARKRRRKASFIKSDTITLPDLHSSKSRALACFPPVDMLHRLRCIRLSPPSQSAAPNSARKPLTRA
eukprot:99936-Amorphochlora_amoeboformis.AAC.2